MMNKSEKKPPTFEQQLQAQVNYLQGQLNELDKKLGRVTVSESIVQTEAAGLRGTLFELKRKYQELEEILHSLAATADAIYTDYSELIADPCYCDPHEVVNAITCPGCQLEKIKTILELKKKEEEKYGK